MKLRFIEDLDALIENQVEESLTLEYKSSGALTRSNDKIKELIKDVTAMANSAGGTIIYGIKEFDDPERSHLPEKITPISRKEFSKERIEDILTSNISPKLEEMIIHPIQLDNPDEVVYVIEIPQSNTAHQNLKDFRYYKRFNFKAEPMADYEVRDVMNRSTNPLIEVSLNILKWIHKSGTEQHNKTARPDSLQIQLINSGRVYASYVSLVIRIPKEYIYVGDIETGKCSIESGLAKYVIQNVIIDRIRDFSETMSHDVGGVSRYSPILPGTSLKVDSITLLSDSSIDSREITWELFADNAPSRFNRVVMKDIPSILRWY